jgi:TPR repeat protein
MLTISKSLSAGQARTYHAREFISERQNYWSRDQQGHSEWQGSLAKEWGLHGNVGDEEFARLSEGRHPETCWRNSLQRSASRLLNQKSTMRTHLGRPGQVADKSELLTLPNPDSSLRVPSDALSSLVGRGRRDALALIAIKSDDRGSSTLLSDDEKQKHLAYLKRTIEREEANPEEQYRIGVKYELGQGVSVDYLEAAGWYLKAAEQRHAAAQCALGDLHLHGRGLPQGSAQAIFWYRKAADQGFADAEFKIGIRYEWGKAVPKDLSIAAVWYRKAADHGHVNAQSKLGDFYLNGKGVSKDYAEAFFWYRKAAEQGIAWAQIRLGELYEYGDGVAQNKREAVAWYLKAAEQGDSNAQYRLGWAYRYGRDGVLKDDVQQAFWLRKAAEQGLKTAQKWLGGLYLQGTGVPQDSQEAYFWSYVACELNKAENISADSVAEQRDAAASSMAREELEHTQDRAKKWLAEHYAKVRELWGE